MSAEEDARMARATLAGRNGGADAVAQLAPLLADESWRVRSAAVDAVVSMGDPTRVASMLLDALRDPANAGRRNAALTALSRMGHQALAVLARVVEDPSADIRKLAVDALGLLADRGAVPLVAPRLTDADPNVRAAAAEALGRVGGEHAARALAGHLARTLEDPLEVSAALLALAQAHVALPWDRLAPHLDDPLTRPAAVAALPWSADPQAPPRLLDALESRAASVSGTAIGAVCSAGMEAPAVAALVQDPAARTRLREVAHTMLRARDNEVASSAAVVAAWVGDLRTPKVLLLHRRSRPWDAAVAQAWKVAGPGGATEVAQVLEELEPEEQALALDLMTSHPTPLVFDAVRRLVVHASADLLERALPALVAADADRAADVLMSRLLDDHLAPEDLQAIAAALEQVAATSPAAARLALHDHNGTTNATTARILAWTAEPSDRAKLRELAGHPDAAVRAAGCLGLARVGTDADRGLLRALLLDESSLVRTEAARALARVGTADDADALAARAQVELPPVLDAALQALAAVAPARAAEELRARMVGASPLVMTALLGGAERAGGQGAFLAGMQVLSHQDPDVLRAGIRALAAARTPEACAAVVPLLTDPRWEVRHAAAVGLGVLLAAGVAGAAERSRLTDVAEREREPLAREAMLRALGGLPR